MTNSIGANPKGSAIGIGMVLLGVPLYYIFAAINRRPQAVTVSAR